MASVRLSQVLFEAFELLHILSVFFVLFSVEDERL